MKRNVSQKLFRFNKKSEKHVQKSEKQDFAEKKSPHFTPNGKGFRKFDLRNPLDMLKVIIS